MQINNNIPNYQSPYLEQNKTLEKIATGLAINKASDNASVMAISDVLRTQASGYTQALSNANSAVASVQIADQAMSEQSKILDNVKEKLLQASNGTTSDAGREAIFKDIQGLMKNFDNIASSTNYNGQVLLQRTQDDKSATDSMTFQVGNNDQDVIYSPQLQSNSSGVGLNDLLNKDASSFNADDARGFLSKVDDAIGTLNSFRSDMGSVQNQLESSAINLLSQQTQTQIAQSELVGANIAQEIGNFDKQNVLSQVGAYVQSQSNVTQQSVLRLLS
ncbi:MAG: flagellin [Arcobacteraceae bacterium]|nr:flagellin [Arcobacteraceae bacterium]